MPVPETDYGALTRTGQIRRLRTVAEAALPRYGVVPVRLTLLAHAFNTTFTVIDQAGARFVLHILRPERDGTAEAGRLPSVESELWWLDHVRADLHLTVPHPVRTPEGAGAVLAGARGTERVCTLFHWLDGRFRSRGFTPAHLHAVGRVTARLHDNSERLQVPAGFDRPTVDRAGHEVEMEAAQALGEYLSPEAGDVVAEAVRRARAAQEELGSGPEVFGVIHADLHQRNYLFQRGELRLIDFGDCGWGHYLYDFAVTLNELTDLPHFGELRRALLAGYRGVRPLSPEHERLIDRFIMLRNAQDLTSFVQDREDPSQRRWVAQIEAGVRRLGEQLRSGG